MREGDDRIVHIVQGEVIPQDGPFAEIAKRLKVEKVAYYGEVVFRRISDAQIGVTVQRVKVGGLPFPFPNMDQEQLFDVVK